jgi:hypothetical protein
MNAPLDRTHYASSQAVADIRDRFGDLRDQVARWEPRPMPARHPVCPHCLTSMVGGVGALAAHLRDDGDAGTRCPALARPCPAEAHGRTVCTEEAWVLSCDRCNGVWDVTP